MANLTPHVELQDMAKLIPASQAKEIADSAELYHELATLAHLINQAANTGEKQVWVNTPISDDAKVELENQQYKIESVKYSAKKDSQYIISWK